MGPQSLGAHQRNASVELPSVKMRMISRYFRKPPCISVQADRTERASPAPGAASLSRKPARSRDYGQGPGNERKQEDRGEAVMIKQEQARGKQRSHNAPPWSIARWNPYAMPRKLGRRGVGDHGVPR